MDAVTYGANLKKLRLEAGLTLEEVARRLKLKRPGPLSTLENSRRVPKASTIRRHAVVLGCEPKELLAGVVTEYDVLRGSSVPTAARPPRTRTLTPIEKKVLKQLGRVDVNGYQRVLELMDEVRRVFPRPQYQESGAQSGETREARGNKGHGRR